MQARPDGKSGWGASQGRRDRVESSRVVDEVIEWKADRGRRKDNTGVVIDADQVRNAVVATVIQHRGVVIT